MVEHSREEKQLLNEVLPNVASQMRAPLSVLYAGMRKLMQEDAPEAELLNQSYYRLLHIVSNLSAAELIDEGRYLCDRSNGDIVELCRQLSRRLEPLMESCGLRYHFSCSKKSCVILFDERLIERMLLNLISNAMKFTPAGGSITLSLQVQKNDVLLSVADTGCGIAKDKMDTVFDRYLHSSRMDPVPYGLGLGLPLCRAIARGHEGRLLVESHEGEGTCVTAALPNVQSPIFEVHDSAFDYVGGFDHLLVELADVLGPEAFQKKTEQ